MDSDTVSGYFGIQSISGTQINELAYFPLETHINDILCADDIYPSHRKVC